MFILNILLLYADCKKKIRKKSIIRDGSGKNVNSF